MGSWNGFGENAALTQAPEIKGQMDPTILKARKKTLLTESLGQNRQSTFTTGPRGATTTGSKTILGA